MLNVNVTGFADYITVEDDTFDLIAYKLYQEELMRDLLMKYNPDYLSYIFFPAGIKLSVPQVEAVQETRTKAPWAR